MDEKWSLRVEFEAQAKNLLNTVEQIIGSLGDLQNVAEGEVAKSLSKLERDLNKAAGGMRKAATEIDETTKSVQSQSAAVKDLQSQLKGLQKVTSKSGTFAIPELQTDLSLSKQRLSEEEKFAQDMINTTNKEFEARRKAADSFYKEMVSTDKRVNAEIARDQKAEADNRYRQAVASNKQIIKDERTTQKTRSAEIKSGMEQRLRAEKDHASQLAEIQKQYDGLANTRYALYDVARTWTVVAGATTGALLAVEGVGASYEHAFADVARTFDGTEKQTAKLRQDLKYLTQEIPESFGTLTEVATLAGQLDIAAGNIASFTETVVMFAATTDVTAENAAMSLGRLIQLTDATQAQSQNLAAAIYETGVNSVATEGQILSMAQEIATIGDLAGFSSAEIVGLASALASIGERPERARGVLLRVFGSLDRAVAASGDQLTQFARLANMSADDFADAWQNRPEQAFRALMHGMEGVLRSGKPLIATMDELGIRNTREIQTLQRLANNMDVYVATQDDANRAFAEGTALQEGFNERTDTLISSLTILRNTVGSIMDNLSNSNLLKPVVDSINNVLVVIDKLTESPIARGIAAITGGLVALVAGIAVYNAAMFRARASVAGLMQAKIALSGQQVALRGGLISLYREYQQLTARINEATAATAANTTATTANTGAANANAIAKRSQGMANLTANTTGAASGMARFGAAAKGALRFLGPIGLAVGVASWGFSQLASSVRDSREEAERSSRQMEVFRETLVADRDSDTIFRTMERELPRSSKAAVDWTSVLLGSADAQEALKNATSDTTDEVERQIVVWGEATRDAFIQGLMGTEGFTEAISQAIDTGDLKSLGIDMAQAVDIGLREGSAGLNAYFDEISARIEQQRAEADAIAWDSSAEAEAVMAARERLDVLERQSEVLSLIRNPMIEFIANSEAAADSLLEGNKVLQALGGYLQDTTEDAVTFSEAMAEAFAQTDSIMATENAIHSLTQAFYDNGAGLNVYSVEGRANMAALQSAIESIYQSNAPEQANAIALGILANLEAQGLATRQELEGAYRAVQLLSGSAGGGAITEEAALRGRIAAYESMNRAFTSIASSSNKAASGIRNKGKAAKETAKEVRTLTDYVNDLSGVFSSAFDIRFGLDISTDNLADEFEDMVEWAENAARAVRDITQRINELNATITGLRASNNTLEYQLRVAREYGDELREQEILAEIAKNNVEISKAQNDRTDATKDLKKAQDQTNKSLSGSTRGSREQRAQVLALVKAYQDQVSELANTNIGQAELQRRTNQLKRAFEDQLRTLGYAPAEIRRYSAAFDDMTVAIQRVPRNVNVDANVSPGQRAVNEFLARINKSKATVNVAANAPKSVGVNVNPKWPKTMPATDIAAAGRITAAKGMNVSGMLTATNATMRTMVVTAMAGGSAAMRNAMRALGFQYGGHVDYLASGGVSGLHPGGPRGTDTVPAWLTPGEFVHNKKAVSYYGLPFMNALNNMQIPKYLASGGSPTIIASRGVSGGNVVELGPRSLSALRREIAVILDGRMVGRAVNKSNAQQGVLGSA